MTQEENAKSYTELINRLEDVKDAIKKQNYGIAIDVLCKPYPDFQVTTHSELKKSGDEKIRKSLSAYFAKFKQSDMWDTDFSFGDIVAWLEKQGNLMKALQISNAKIGELIEENYYLKEQLEKQGKNNMGISEATKKKLEDNLNKALEKETPESCNEFLDEQGEQKSVDVRTIGYWHVEDVEQKPTESNNIKGILLVHDETLNNLLERYKTSATFKTLIVNLHNWWNNTRRHLLSFNIEQKPAWSEEDEKILNLIIARLHSHPNVEVEEYGKDYHWLNSLKDKYTWKPSDEQMNNK